MKNAQRMPFGAAVVLAVIALVPLPSSAAPVVVRDALQQLRDVMVQGTVYATVDGKHRPLAGASVELQTNDADAQHQIVASVVTDGTGHYVISNPSARSGATYEDVAPGVYRLFASYRTSRVSAGVIETSLTRTLTRDIDLGVVVKAGGAAPPPPSTTFFVSDRLANGGSTVQGLFQNTRLIDPCMTGPACMMTYGYATPMGPFLKPTEVSSVAELVKAIRATPRYAASTSVLIFLHGYNNDFADPFEIGATWLSSFDPAQPVIVYSWPSNHKLAKYLDDETNNTWDQNHFRDFMLALMNEPDAPKTINILAHSMGNRVALGFLDYLASAKPQTGSHIGQVIFAAPDVDSATFWEAIPRISAVASGLTMYGSNHDNALRASRALHGHCRAGLVGCDYAVPNVANFNAIDASMFHCDFLGHGYWLSSDTLHADIVAVLKDGVMKPGSPRANLKAGPLPQSYVFDATLRGDTSCQAQATGN